MFKKIIFSATSFLLMASSALAEGEASGEGASTSTTSTSTEPSITLFELRNPLSADNLAELLASIGDFLFGVGAALLAIFILIGAYQFMTSAGNPDGIERGRKTITWALVGFLVIMLAGGAATIIGDILGVDDVIDPVDLGGQAPPVTSAGKLISVLVDLAGWMFGILMALGIIFVLYSAFLYMTSGGDTDRVGTARKVLTYAIVAMVIAALAGGVSVMVQNLLGVSSSGQTGLTPEQIEQARYDQCVDRCIRDAGSEISAQNCIVGC